MRSLFRVSTAAHRLSSLPNRLWRFAGVVAFAGVTGCATDQPSAVEGIRPSALALRASVSSTDASSLAQVRVSVFYLRQGGAVVALGAPQTITLDKATQQVPVAVDIATCLADPTRAGSGGNAPAADECNVQLNLEFLLNSVRVDQQVLTNVSVKPGQTATVPQAVALVQVADVRLVLPPANAQGTAMRLERGQSLTVGVQVIDAGNLPITGRPVTWVSANPAIATVSNTGVVTGVALGSTQLTASVAGREVSVTANIVAPSQTITVASSGTSGTGQVQSVPAGIACAVQGGVTSGTCAAAFPGDITVQLVATAGSSSDFLAFAGECSTVQGAQCNIATPAAPKRVMVAFRGRQTLTVVGSATASNGTVVVAGGTLACTVSGATVNGSCVETYPEGTIVTLAATAAPGHTVLGWSGDCSASTTASCTLTMDRARTVTPRFASDVQVAVRGEGNGSGAVVWQGSAAECVVAGGSTSGTCSRVMMSGTTVTLQATARPGSEFAGWSGPCSGTGACTFTSTQATQVTANFRLTGIPFTLIVIGPAGATVTTSTGSTCTSTDPSATCNLLAVPGSPVTFTASSPDPETRFLRWGGPCAIFGSNPVCAIVPGNEQLVSATFQQPEVPVTVSVNGPAGASITASTGESCVSDGSIASCRFSLDVGATVSFTAAAPAGARFVGWGDACAGFGANTTCTVTVTNGMSVSATYQALLVPLTIIVNGPVGGSVTTSTGAVCETNGAARTCTVSVRQGASVTLIADPGRFSTFAGFSESCGGRGACTIVMSQPRTVSAQFTGRQATITLQLSGVGGAGGTVTGVGALACTVDAGAASQTCTATVTAGQRIVLSASPTSGSIFTGWSGPCTGTGPCSFDADDVTITGSFRIVTATVRVTRASGPGGSGQIVFGPEGARCTITATGTTGRCETDVIPGASVTFQVDPSVGFPFLGWGGACESFGTNPVCTLTVTTSVGVTARFQSPPPL